MARNKVTLMINPALRDLAKEEGISGSLPSIVREGVKAAALHWFKKFLPKHFSKQAFYLYPWAYQRRTKESDDNKRRYHPENVGVPWMYSGESRRQIVEGQPEFKAAKGAKSMIVTLRLPFARVMNFHRGKGAKKHDFDASMQAIHPGEHLELMNLAGEYVDAEIKKALKEGERHMEDSERGGSRELVA